MTATKQPSGNATSTLRRLCSRAPSTTSSRAALGRTAQRRHGDLAPAGQVGAGDRLLGRAQVVDGPADDDAPALLTGVRADVDDPVGGADGVFVVLDDDERVAQLLQPHQRLDEAVVVALVQADGRLVEDVQHADETRPDLGREPDALRLAAGQRRRRAVEGQVVQPDVDQEAQPGVDLLEDPLADHPVAIGQGELAQPGRGVADRQGRDLGDRTALDGDAQDLGLEAGALARGARDLAHVALVLLARPVAVGLGVAALDPGHHALVVGVVGAVAAVSVAVTDVHLVADAVQHGLLRPGRQLFPRRVDVEADGLGDALQQPQEVLAGLPAGPRRDGALGQAGLRVGDDELGVDLLAGAEAGALLARAERRVERERARLELVDGQGVVVRAGQPLGVAAFAVRVVLGQVDEVEDEHAAGQAEGRLDGVGDPLLARRLGREAVDDRLDGVLLLLLQLRRVGQRVHDAVDAHPREALGLQVGEQVDVFALALADDRREHLEPGALGHLEDAVDDLLRGLLGDRLAADRAVRATDAGPEQAQVVVDLGDGADGGPRVLRRRLLVDGDRRREALDEVDVGLVHLAQELPGVGGQRLDVAALALGEDRVEGQARLARAGQPGEHDHRVAGQVEVDVLEVVLAGTSDNQAVVHAESFARREGGQSSLTSRSDIGDAAELRTSVRGPWGQQTRGPGRSHDRMIPLTRSGLCRSRSVQPPAPEQDRHKRDRRQRGGHTA